MDSSTTTTTNESTASGAVTETPANTAKEEPSVTTNDDTTSSNMVNVSDQVTKMEVETTVTEPSDHVTSLKRKNSIDQNDDGRVSPLAKQMAIEQEVETTTNNNETVQQQEEITNENYARLLAQTMDELRKEVCIRKLASLGRTRAHCIASLAEQYYLEQNMNYLEYDKWRQSIATRPNPFLQNFVEKNYENQATIFLLEQALIKKFGRLITDQQQQQQPLIEQSVLLRGNGTSTVLSSSSTNKHPSINNNGTSNQLSKIDPGGGGVSSVNGERPSIADRARHEAHVLKRIAELRKSGLWSLKRLPKLVEPGRPKTHWDYLLDEMSWMATDFQQERKWKINCCKKLALAVNKHFREKQARAEQAEREESRRAQRQSALVAREVTLFWRSIEKIVKYKQDTMLEEKRKATMNLRLNMIVDQTEKYSSWLMESLNQAANSATAAVTATAASIDKKSETMSTMSDEDSSIDDDDEEDDESTIEAEEKKRGDNQVAVSQELDELKMESELPLEDLLKSYKIDQNYFEKRDDEDKSSINGDSSDSDDEIDDDDDDDEEVSSGDMSEEDDDEETIEEEERQLRKQQQQQSTGYQNELDELNADNSLSIEELMAKLAAASNEKQQTVVTETHDATTTTSATVNEVTVTPEEVKTTTTSQVDGEKEQQQQALLNTIADKAQSFQPTGYTLETTQVKTPVPTALLKHSLREYQHVGLDWLVTMHDNKLNGILADEMGLGKTIQTIALLAHLACEKANWGPHLIVVPTSVMLNWELEFKKWAPGFKILTYYGSPKERKLKRQGWTKSNAFHVCITSYKLVVQDHSVFRRKKWKYFILDEAQNIKNFKSQRWQALLNFQSQRRLLLTGTPLQNNLMELWSLMHFLMPHVFSSHREFQLWFNNPLKSMVEGNQEYNEQIVKRLHKVLRPFILRRLKKDVEKQMPKKYEHILRCKLSKRQRLLYDEFMSLASTRDTLAEGRYMSVINILMQLRKVCNHPDLFDPRPTLSPFVSEPIDFHVPSCVFNVTDESLNERLRSVLAYQPAMPDMELLYSAFACHRAKRLQTPRRLIEEILTTDLTTLPHDNLDTTSIDIDCSFFANSTLIGLEICDNPTFRHKLKHYLAKSKISVDLDALKTEHFRSLVHYLIRLNKQKCSLVKPVYGTDLHQCIGPSQVMTTITPKRRCVVDHTTSLMNVYGATSHATCINTLDYEANKHKSECYWSQTQTLADLINWTRRSVCDVKCNNDLLNVLSRFVVYVPHVWCATKRCSDPYESEPIKLRTPHPNPSYYARQRTLIEDITDRIQHVTTNNPLSQLASREYLRMNNIVESSMLTQFPEKRLIQYDCGKLQLLATLLRQLHSETHRVLVFTQMTRMLDILENFLNYHGYKYLRLDGSTGIDKRQMLMERFNNDKRIFAFILSTRSGGIGVNLTGADTVIFYDSDWNPTMDAQAQDRCHRIGQTRDVHIYRLISERTVEENILRKASQKRLLSDMTIEGGCFTTAFLTKHHITELFEDGDGGAANSATTPMAIDDSTPPPPPTVAPVVETVSNKESVAQLEEALAMVEDETDVKAAKELREEVRADIDEFDENQVTAEAAAAENGDDKTTRRLDERLEMEFKSIETELRPVERYALKFMESFGEVSLDATQEQTDVEMEQVKKDWELTRLKQLKEEEERKAELEEDEMLYSYSKSEIWLNEEAEQMPLWCPLTPPIYESDVFIDHARTRVEVEENTTLDYLYGTEPISEALLPPIYYAKKSENNKRMKLDSIGGLSPNKKQNTLAGVLQTTPPSLGLLSSSTTTTTTTSSVISSAVPTTKGVYGALNAAATAASNKLDNIVMTRPLFDKPNAAMVKLRRDVKMQKLKGWTAYKFDIIRSTLPVAPETTFGKDDWLPNDDFVIIHSLQVLMELPLTLQAIAPGHQPNWDLISDLVSSNYTSYFRSALECRKRFESVILKREEMCLSEIQSKKQLQLQQQQARQEQLGQPITGGNKYKQPTKPAPLNICKTKTLRTNQLSVQDNYKLLLLNIRHRFESISRIAKRRNPLSFTYVPLANNNVNVIMHLNNRPGSSSQSTQNINAQYAQMVQHQQQSQQYELLLSKFAGGGVPTTTASSNQSNIVLNAMNAVAIACRPPGQAATAGAAGQAITINLDSISFKTPKHLADMKVIKDKQLKMTVVTQQQQQPERVLSFSQAPGGSQTATGPSTTATIVTPIAMSTTSQTTSGAPTSQSTTTAAAATATQIAIPVQSATGKIILQQQVQSGVSQMGNTAATMSSPQQKQQQTMMPSHTTSVIQQQGQASNNNNNNATILSQLQQQKNATTAIAAQLAASVGVNTTNQQSQPSIVQITPQQHHGKQQPITVTTLTATTTTAGVGGSNQPTMIVPVVQSTTTTPQLPVKSQSNTTVAGLLAASQTSGAYYQQQQQRAAMLQQQQAQQAQSIQHLQHGQLIQHHHQGNQQQQATLVQTSPLNTGNMATTTTATLVVGTQLIQQQQQQGQVPQQQMMNNPSGRGGSPLHIQHQQQQQQGAQTISSLISSNMNNSSGSSSSPTISLLQQQSHPSQQQLGSQQSIRLYATNQPKTTQQESSSTPGRKKQQETVQQQLASSNNNNNMTTTVTTASASPSSSSSSLVMLPIVQPTTNTTTTSTVSSGATNTATALQQQPNSPQTHHHHHQPPATIKQITQQQQRKMQMQIQQQQQQQQQQQLNQSLSSSLSSQLYTQGSFQSIQQQQQQQANMLNQQKNNTTSASTNSGGAASQQIVMTGHPQTQQAQLVTNRQTPQQGQQQIQSAMIVNASQPTGQQTGGGGQYQQINQTIISNLAAKQQHQQQQQNRAGNIQGPILIRQHPGGQQIQQLVAATNTTVSSQQQASSTGKTTTTAGGGTATLQTQSSSNNTIDSLIKSQQMMRSNSSGSDKTTPTTTTSANSGSQIITATLISSTTGSQQQIQQAGNSIIQQPQTTQQHQTSNNQQFTTVIKPINSVTLSLPTTSGHQSSTHQQKQSIITTTNQPQQLRQFQIMTTMNQSGGVNSGIQQQQQQQQQPVTQLLIQHHQSGTSSSGAGAGGNGTVVSIGNNNSNNNVAQSNQTIRKVGSASNLASLHQKVQVQLNRPGIQIVQTSAAAAASRLNKPSSSSTSTGGGTITTMSVNPNASSGASIQILQQQQQQQSTQQAKPISSFTTQTSSTSSLASLMNSNNTKSTMSPGIQQQQVNPMTSSSSSSQTVKTLLTNSNNNASSIISIHPAAAATTTANTSGGLQQAVPINLNSSLSQVLRQFSATGSATTTTTTTTTSVPTTNLGQVVSTSTPSITTSVQQSSADTSVQLAASSSSDVVPSTDTNNAN